MRAKQLHLADEQLLLHAGGELRGDCVEPIRAHLECCSDCRLRLASLEKTLAEFGDAHRELRNAELPLAQAARTRLIARLSDSLSEERDSGQVSQAWTTLASHRGAAITGLVVAVCLLFAIWFREPLEKSQRLSSSLGRWEEPDLRLTPGATVPVTKSEVCGQTAAQAEPVIPISLEHRVFELYGVRPPQPGAYEVDYLITPELGGATDIRNLWPEPYGDTVWNAHVKDQLEDRLHRMVCHGDVDLATAQRDISTDWIAAYRKYFHAERPISDGSSSNLPALRHALPRT